MAAAWWCSFTLLLSQLDIDVGTKAGASKM
jgi:hypothetical protein